MGSTRRASLAPVDPAARDLAAIYASDPGTRTVLCPAPGQPAPHGRRQARGYLLERRTAVAGSGGHGALTVVDRQTTLQVITGALGRPADDTVLLVGTARYRYTGETVPLGDGREEILTLVAESA